MDEKVIRTRDSSESNILNIEMTQDGTGVTDFNPNTRRQRQVGLCVDQGQPGLQIQFQDSHDYT